MEWAYLPGCSVSYASLPIAARLAGIAFFPSVFTAALFPRSTPCNPARNLIPSRSSLVFNFGTAGKGMVDFPCLVRMMAHGDGVRLITAVLLAGQMMTPDKYIVAEPCPRQ
jgi:hypothetical protein